MKTKELTISAVFMALTFVVTYFIQIPIPLGYFNVGNTVILLACSLVPLPYGILIGSLGSAMADLLSYPLYTLPTLIIKALMPLVFYLLIEKMPWKMFKYYIAAAVSTLIPLFGYTFVGGILYGSLYIGLSQFPGLLLEYVANLVLFSALISVILKIKKLQTDASR